MRRRRTDMPQRRNQAKHQQKLARKSIRSASMIEALERRCLLTTLIGGGYLNGVPVANTFLYDDTRGSGTAGLAIITVAGNVRAEFIGYSPTGPVDLVA